jgi:hypothetical protein
VCVACGGTDSSVASLYAALSHHCIVRMHLDGMWVGQYAVDIVNSETAGQRPGCGSRRGTGPAGCGDTKSVLSRRSQLRYCTMGVAGRLAGRLSGSLRGGRRGGAVNAGVRRPQTGVRRLQPNGLVFVYWGSNSFIAAFASPQSVWHSTGSIREGNKTPSLETEGKPVVVVE